MNLMSTNSLPTTTPMDISATIELFQYMHGALGVEATITITEDDIFVESTTITDVEGCAYTLAEASLTHKEIIREWEVLQEFIQEDGFTREGEVGFEDMAGGWE